jgi:cis-3-alkyl-4-acyloxetan-2-one decarboxylase
MKESGIRLDKTVRRVYPFGSHWMKVNGFDLHYVDEGAGEPIVMVHGNPTWSFYFRHLISGLRCRYRVIAMDHIGCGLSEKPDPRRYDFRLKSRINDFNRFCLGLDLRQKITLVVHDWGGMIAIAHAVDHPERIGRLVILNTAAFLPPGNKKVPLRLRLIRNLRHFAGPAVLGANLFARAAVHMAARTTLSKPARKGLLAPYNSWKNRLATLKFVQDIPLSPGDPGYDIVFDTDRRLHLLSSIPTLILWGARDFVFDKDYFFEWRNRFPGATTCLLKNAGHYVLEDAPEEALNCLNAFLSTHPPGG